MQRRQVLSGLGACALSTLGGCSGLTGGGRDTATPVAEVSQWNFESSSVETDDGVERPPQITCTPSENRVRITGVVYQGRRCDALAPRSMSLEDGEYRLVVAAYSRDASCGDLLVAAEYAVNVAFAERLPDTVTAVEATERHGEETRTEPCR